MYMYAMTAQKTHVVPVGTYFVEKLATIYMHINVHDHFIMLTQSGDGK